MPSIHSNESDTSSHYSDWQEDYDPLSCPFKSCEFTSPLISDIKSHCALAHGTNMKVDSVYDWIKLINKIKDIKFEESLVPVDDDPLYYSFDEPEVEESLESQVNALKLELSEYKKQVHEAFMEKNASTGDAGDYYFDSYSSIEIHEIMLKDSVRSDAYRDFVYDNKHLFKDKIIMDVGCGSGILSLFAAKAGAAQVYAIDNSEIIEKAKRIAVMNKLDHKITFIKGKMEQIVIPEQVDLIISEWMGYFLLFEGMLDSVLWARDAYLKPDGIMAPQHSVMKIAAFSDEGWMNDSVSYWTNVYGFNMNILSQPFHKTAQVVVLSADKLVSSNYTIKNIDAAKDDIQSLDFSSNFRLAITQDCKIHGIVGWFDVIFTDSCMFSTGPASTPTHWKQTCFIFKQGVEVCKGAAIVGKIMVGKRNCNNRELDVGIECWVEGNEAEIISGTWVVA